MENFSKIKTIILDYALLLRLAFLFAEKMFPPIVLNTLSRPTAQLLLIILTHPATRKQFRPISVMLIQRRRPEQLPRQPIAPILKAVTKFPRRPMTAVPVLAEFYFIIIIQRPIKSATKLLTGPAIIIPPTGTPVRLLTDAILCSPQFTIKPAT